MTMSLQQLLSYVDLKRSSTTATNHCQGKSLPIPNFLSNVDLCTPLTKNLLIKSASQKGSLKPNAVRVSHSSANKLHFQCLQEFYSSLATKNLS